VRAFLSFMLDHFSPVLLNEIGLKICRRDCSGARPEENRDQAAAAHGVRVEVAQRSQCNPLLATHYLQTLHNSKYSGPPVAIITQPSTPPCHSSRRG
jgi:hypothetical protein